VYPYSCIVGGTPFFSLYCNGTQLSFTCSTSKYSAPWFRLRQPIHLLAPKTTISRPLTALAQVQIKIFLVVLKFTHQNLVQIKTSKNHAASVLHHPLRLIAEVYNVVVHKSNHCWPLGLHLAATENFLCVQ
jgi:hypothetical protein